MGKHRVSQLSYFFAGLDLLSSEFLFFDLLSSPLLFSDSSNLCFSFVYLVGILASKLPSMIYAHIIYTDTYIIHT